MGSKSFRFAPHKVHVYASVDAQQAGDKPLAIVNLEPMSIHGFDNYVYKHVLYPGFVDIETHTQVRIFLDRAYQRGTATPLTSET
jgi:hypothetical protein